MALPAELPPGDVAPCGDSQRTPPVRKLRLPRTRRDRTRDDNRDCARYGQEAASQTNELVAHPCLGADRASLSRALRDFLFVERGAPDRCNKAYLGDRSRSPYPA